MKRLFLLLFLLASPAIAQEAALPAPETSAPGTKLRVRRFSADLGADHAAVWLVVLRDDNTVHREVGMLQIADDPTTSPVNEYRQFMSALLSPAAGETGSAERRAQFRILTWIVDNSRLRDDDGQVISVTLVP